MLCSRGLAAALSLVRSCLVYINTFWNMYLERSSSLNCSLTNLFNMTTNEDVYWSKRVVLAKCLIICSIKYVKGRFENENKDMDALHNEQKQPLWIRGHIARHVDAIFSSPVACIFNLALRQSKFGSRDGKIYNCVLHYVLNKF